MKSLRVLTWHVHGNYLWYLSNLQHELYLPVKADPSGGYGGRGSTFPWPDNVHDVPAHEVRDLDVDVVLFQSHRNWQLDQHEILSPAQRQLPRIFVEHDPPRESPTDTRHPVDDPDVLLVHVTHFNELMWDSGSTPTRVIEHGVVVPDDVNWTGEIERGIVVINGLGPRGRRLGKDVFLCAREQVPLDLVGMGSETLGGLGEVAPPDLARFEARYRFFFNPIRYTSLGLAVCEAMQIGLPVVGLATTEMVSAVRNGVTGYVSTNVEELIGHMQRLVVDVDEARRLGRAARVEARRRFGIERFVRDWNAVFAEATVGRNNDRRPVAVALQD